MFILNIKFTIYFFILKNENKHPGANDLSKTPSGIAKCLGYLFIKRFMHP
jgi:hypothetical protein